MPSSTEWECESIGSSSSASSDSSLDDELFNARLSPQWSKYRGFILSKGYRLDTLRDVREYYRRHGVDAETCLVYLSKYLCGCTISDENALCRDPGLPENLFRATCCTTGMNLMIKAVHPLSREVQHMRNMSSSPLRHDPMNHCIPILDIIDVCGDGICFVVMEEWSSHLLSEIPLKLRDFLSAIHQCIEHIVFMHRNRIVHLDISLHNFLADYHGRCACIDYELSRRVEDVVSSATYLNWRWGTEVPPELECGQVCNFYMVDVWALGMFILRACKLVNLYIPEMLHLTKPMLSDSPDKRPSAAIVLQEFERIVCLMEEERLDKPC